MEDTSHFEGLINRIRLYLDDATKVSSLMIRMAAVLSNHKLEDFGLDETLLYANI